MKKMMQFLLMGVLLGVILTGCQQNEATDTAAPPPGPGARPADVPPPGAAGQGPSAPGPIGGGAPAAGAGAGSGAMAGPK